MTQDEITYKNLDSKLVDIIPELEPEFDDEARNWASDGPHMLYGHLFARLLPKLFADERHNSELLKKIFLFFERIATHRDEDVRGVVGLSVCQEIAADEVILQRSQRYMGEMTKKFCAELMNP